MLFVIFSKIKGDDLIFIHNYNRDQYHILGQFYITVKIRGSLALLIRNSNVNKIQEIIHIILENLFLKLL